MSQLFFKKRFQDAIRAGSKSTTIRRWNKPKLRVGQRAFCPGLGWLAIEGVDQVDIEMLQECDAVADGFATLSEMKENLGEMYPGHLNDNMHWYRIRFHLHALYLRAKKAKTSQANLF